MLKEFYTEEIAIKGERIGSPYEGYTYKNRTIKGAVQHKSKKVFNQNGEEVVSNTTLFTEEQLSIEDIIVYNGRDRKIVDILTVFDHLGMNAVDHYEVLF